MWCPPKFILMGLDPFVGNSNTTALCFSSGSDCAHFVCLDILVECLFVRFADVNVPCSVVLHKGLGLCSDRCSWKIGTAMFVVWNCHAVLE